VPGSVPPRQPRWLARLPSLLFGRPLARTPLACALLCCLLWTGCRADSSERTLANEQLRSVELGKGLTLHAYPTTRATLEDSRIRLHANGARVLLCLASSGAGSHELTIELGNLPAGASLACSAWRERQKVQIDLDEQLAEPHHSDAPELSGGSLPDDPRCTPPGRLGPAEEPGWVRWQLSVPGSQSCPDGVDSSSGVTLSSGGSAPGTVRFAVAGDLQGDRYLARRIGLEAERRELSFLVLLGNLSSGSDSETELTSMAEVLAELAIPVYATVGCYDVAGGGDQVFRELFGPTDVDFVHRQVRFVLLDSADAMLDPLQYEWLERILGRDARMTLLFTHTPPFDPEGLRDQGFVSHREAARFVSLLASRKVDALFAGKIHSYARTTYAGVPAYLTGATGGEALDEIGPHFLEVRVDPSDPARPVEVSRVDLP